MGIGQYIGRGLRPTVVEDPPLITKYAEFWRIKHFACDRNFSSWNWKNKTFEPNNVLSFQFLIFRKSGDASIHVLFIQFLRKKKFSHKQNVLFLRPSRIALILPFMSDWYINNVTYLKQYSLSFFYCERFWPFVHM